MDKDFFRDKCVLVMGLGQFGGGVDSAVFAAQTSKKVIVTDLADEERLKRALWQLDEYRNIEYHLEGHSIEDFGPESNVDIVIVNPAIRPDNKFLVAAKEAGKIITSQIEIFFQLCPAKTIGITGANGKSTTAALTAHLLEAGCGQEGIEYNKVYLGGNIGNKPLLTELDNINADDIVVLELSSFQIDLLTNIQAAPDVAVVTNLTPNHLDRYGTFDKYCDSKENSFKFQKLDANNPAVSIFNAENDVTAQWYEKYKDQPGRKSLTFKVADVPDELAREFQLVGKANLSDLAAALTVANLYGIDSQRLKQAVGSFKPLPHRLELVEKINGVRWYNDSIATTPTSSIAALNAFEGPKIIIAGGYDKNLPFDKLGETIAKEAKIAILIGDTAEKIAEAVNAAGSSDVRIEMSPSLADAVNTASALASAGDVVMLSPACASYDMFDNYKQRGEVFCRLVKSLTL